MRGEGTLTWESRRSSTAPSVLLVLAFLLGGAVSAGAGSLDPVANGDFELYADASPGPAPTDSGRADEALFWETKGILGETTTFEDADGDGDREAVIASCLAPDCWGVRNLLQSLTATSQAFSANFTAYTFVVEEGSVPDEASVWIRISFRPACLEPSFPYYCDVTLAWDGSSMQTDEEGLVRLDPAQTRFVCTSVTPDGGVSPATHDPICERFREDWEAADEQQRRALLDQARITHQFFWAFSKGADPVVVDDVSIEGAAPFLPGPLRGEA